MRLALRAIAVGLGIAAVIDPVSAFRRRDPLPVDIRVAPTPRAAVVRQRLLDALGSNVAIGTTGPAGALVVIGDVLPAPMPTGVPIFALAEAPAARATLRIVRVSAPESVLAGQTAVVTAVVEGTNADGQRSAIVLEQDHVELARVEHRWSGPRERFVAELRYAPPAAGVEALRVVARPAAGTDGNTSTADLALIATSRPLRVLAYECRPSWAAGFVRRALEADPAFQVSAFVRSSREIGVHTGGAPQALTTSMAESFDAAIIGGPEDLTAAEVDALDWFVRARGGSVIFLPDRRPSGAYLRLAALDGFDEVLLGDPVGISTASANLYGAEFAIPHLLPAGGEPLASVMHGGTLRPVIVSAPHGRGRMVFSGALDSWRYRARDDDGFARYWTGVVASLAAGAPPAVAVHVEPTLAAPGDLLKVRAVLRETVAGRRRAQPAAGFAPIDASLIAADGSVRMIRLWPGAPFGEFEATLPAPAAGRYDVRASAGGATADAPLIVREAVLRPEPQSQDVLRAMSAASGGVFEDDSSVGSVVAHLRRLPREEVSTRGYPARSNWWLVAFTTALCLEWGLRRRAGLR